MLAKTRLTWLPLSLWACSPGEAPRPDSGFQDLEIDNPSAWVYSPDDTASTDVDLDAMAVALQEWIDLSYTYNAEGLFEGYKSAIESRGYHPSTGAGCPQYEAATIDNTTFERWFGICNTTEDAAFAGQVGAFDTEDNSLQGSDITGWFVPPLLKADETLFTGSNWSGMAYIRDLEDRRFWGAGTLSAMNGVGTDGRSVKLSQVMGSYLWDGSGDEDAWFGTVVSIDWGVRVDWDPEGNIIVVVTGGLPRLSATGATIVTDWLLLEYRNSGKSCPIEPNGNMEYRDADGLWFEIEFEGFSEKSKYCDGCGHVSSEGEIIGEVCVDFSPWVEFGDSPW